MPLDKVSDKSVVRQETTHAISTPLHRPLAQHNADLIIQSVRAFPTMMLRRETLPWYIHKQSELLSELGQNALPEALSTCMSIAQMYALRTPDTKAFLWRSIRAEYQRHVCDVIAPGRGTCSLQLSNIQ